MATIHCTCCQRILKADHAARLCWECSGRPKTEGHVVPPAGERSDTCPHMVPKTTG